MGKGLPKMDTFGSADPYLIFLREIKLKQGGHKWVPIHRTEKALNTRNPIWKSITLGVDELCGNNYGNRIRVDCFDWDRGSKDDFIGSFDTDLSAIIGDITSQMLDKRSKNRGTVTISSGKIERKFSFYDYVRGLTRLKFSLAIDFTESNGKQDNPSSRHFIDESGKIANIYQKIMTLIKDTIAIFDPTNSVRAFGFGAKLKPTETMTPIFNFHQKGELYNGINNVLDAYLNWSQTVTLAGPTNHAPVINKANELADKHKDGSLYIVIIIITDDCPHDIAETKGAIAKAATLPVSIIFVGVGENDFQGMDEVIRPTGTVARDVVTFVRIEDHLDQQKMFISESQCRHAIFSKIPDQLVSWMNLKDIKPQADSSIASAIQCTEQLSIS
ncbi:copine-9-like [Ptychodera flava]|uniref:copine-9-like n=1 Tax=Ptychodera flava TaxID=63121 RepID=UPI00396A897F